MLDPDSINALLAGLAAFVAVVVTSLRKRDDTQLEQLRRRVSTLEAEVVEEQGRTVAADRRADLTFGQLLAANRIVYALRLELAQHGLPDPTTTQETK